MTEWRAPFFFHGPRDTSDPEACIDCDACERVCPVTAIFPEDELPDKWKDFAQKNADYYTK